MDKTVTASELRKHQRNFFDEVCNNHNVLLTTRQHGGNIVIMSETDYLSMLETFHLLRSPNNRKRLHSAIKAEGETHNSMTELFADLNI